MVIQWRGSFLVTFSKLSHGALPTCCLLSPACHLPKYTHNGWEESIYKSLAYLFLWHPVMWWLHMLILGSSFPVCDCSHSAWLCSVERISLGNEQYLHFTGNLIGGLRAGVSDSTQCSCKGSPAIRLPTDQKMIPTGPLLCLKKERQLSGKNQVKIMFVHQAAFANTAAVPRGKVGNIAWQRAWCSG